MSPNSLALPAAGSYTLDTGASTITFATRHLFGLGAVNGSFQVRRGDLVIAEPVEASTFVAVADAASFDTGHAQRDPQVRSAGFLDVQNHPEITFRSTRVEHAGPDWLVHGDLVARGSSAPLTLTVTSLTPAADGSFEVQASATVDRYAHGLLKMKGIAGRRLNLTLTGRARPA